MTTRRINGATVRALRDALGIAQGDLAMRIGVHPAYLSNIERGVKQPSPATVRRLADAMGVTVDAITYAVDDRQAS